MQREKRNIKLQYRWTADFRFSFVLLASRPLRSSVQEIQYRDLGEHRFGNAVALGASALFGGLRRLQIGAEMARALDDLASLRQALGLETAQRRLDVVAVERLRQRRRIVGGLRHAGGDMGPRHEGGVAENSNPAEGELRAFQIVDRLQDRLVDQADDLAKL